MTADADSVRDLQGRTASPMPDARCPMPDARCPMPDAPFSMPNDARCFKSAEPTADAPLGETPRPHCLPNALAPQCPMPHAQFPIPNYHIVQNV
ncbi:hypothetical protein [Tolypothrix sp. VBCCA 56010]|uniref:hypothetical protein n=1 Tax=Tolypothrix sp. VBCCA 56010 TaxID=3137731 RepID=UPI003D7C68B3